MKARFIYLNSYAYKNRLVLRSGLSAKFLGINDYLFKISDYNKLQEKILFETGSNFKPLLKIKKGTDGCIYLKVLSTPELFKDLKNCSFTNDELAVFFDKVVNYFTGVPLNPWIIRNKKLEFHDNICIMGILNVTPDSFSDGGLYSNTEKATEHALQMVEQGGDIIDIGGESTRPGAKSLRADEEIERVVPVIQQLRQRSDVIISVDTYKSAVAQAALEAGADIVNDISGTLFDRYMEATIAETGCPYSIMHTGGRPHSMQDSPHYEDVVETVYGFLHSTAQGMHTYCGGRLMLDPGIGFGKTLEHNLELLNHLDDFSFMGYPILIGVSRKSFLGQLSGKDVKDRDDLSNLVHAAMVLKKASVFRVHDVEKANQMRSILLPLMRS